MARKKTGSKRWPPNIGVNNGNVRYRRQIPKDLSSIAGKKVYQEYLSTLTPESSFEDALQTDTDTVTPDDAVAVLNGLCCRLDCE